MASIKDAFEESLQDNHAILKYIIFAIPVFYCVYLYSENNMAGFWTMATVTFWLLFGIFIKCTSNVRNGEAAVLPSFNIFAILWAGLKGLIALGPSIAINCFLASFVCSYLPNIFTEPNTLVVFQVIVWCFFGSFMLTGYLCYAKSFKIADAYNFKAISEFCMDILVAVLFMIPQVLIADAILIIPVSYVIWVFFGLPHPIAVFYWCMVLIFNLAMCGHYLAQMDYESIGTKENEDKII